MPALPERVTPHSFRRTFAALLYLRGEDPVYVMEQLGHTDPKLALRIYAKVIGDRRRRGRGERLVAVIRGVEWAPLGTKPAGSPDDALAPLLMRQGISSALPESLEGAEARVNQVWAVMRPPAAPPDS